MDETLHCEFDGGFECWRKDGASCTIKEHLPQFYYFKEPSLSISIRCASLLQIVKSRYKFLREKFSEDKTLLRLQNLSFIKFSGHWSLLNQDETNPGKETFHPFAFLKDAHINFCMCIINSGTPVVAYLCASNKQIIKDLSSK